LRRHAAGTHVLICALFPRQEVRNMPSQPAYDTPSTIYAVDGEVVLDGPDGIGLSMTPNAAAETARRLAKAADEARSQPSRQGADTAETAEQLGEADPGV
jgi:hypothetical protein